MKNKPLPPGQRELDHFPRYGLWQYANRIKEVLPLKIKLKHNSKDKGEIYDENFSCLSRIEQTSDFHCVTTWSYKNLRWSGYRFSDFYNQLVKPLLEPSYTPKYVRFTSEDTYETYMHFEDLMNNNVILADMLNDEPLDFDHGGKIRLVAPSHYGFKNAKHINSINFCDDLKGYKSPALHWHEHTRARVDFEERGSFLPSLFWRIIGPCAIPTVLYVFRRAAKKRLKK